MNTTVTIMAELFYSLRVVPSSFIAFHKPEFNHKIAIDTIDKLGVFWCHFQYVNNESRIHQNRLRI